MVYQDHQVLLDCQEIQVSQKPRRRTPTNTSDNAGSYSTIVMNSSMSMTVQHQCHNHALNMQCPWYVKLTKIQSDCIIFGQQTCKSNIKEIIDCNGKPPLL